MILPVTKKDCGFLASAKSIDFEDGWTEKMIADGLDSNNLSGDILSIDGVKVGFILYSLSIDDADIESVYVFKEYRKKGYGKALVQGVIEKVKSLCKRAVFLEVKDKNAPAINLYLSLGFNKINVRKKYYLDGSDAIVMKKEI